MDVHQLFSSLKKEAECPLCLDTVKEPKTLPCLHSFCLECLDKHAGYARRRRETMIKCPVCLTDFNIPKSDTFSDLPTSFHLNRLVDILALRDDSVQIQTCNSCDDNSAVTSYCFVCQSFLCATCLEAHQRLKATRGHRNVLIEKLQAQDVEELIHRPVMCTQKYHQNESLEYFCKDCNTCVCMKCGFVSHSRHTMLDIQQAAEERKVEITKAVDKAKAEIGVVQTKIESQKEFMKKSTDEMLAAQSKVTAIVDELVRILREHEDAVKKRLTEINEAQQRDHATRTEEFQLTVSQLNGFVERGNAILNRNIPSEIIRTEMTVTSRLEELSKAARVMILQPLHFSYVANEKLEKYRTIMKNSGPGKAIASLTDPALSLAGCEPKVLDVIKPCSEVVFKLTTRDSDGNQIYNEEDNLTVHINPPSEVKEEKEINNFKDGKYSIFVYPKLACDIVIKLNGIPLTQKVKIVPEEDFTSNVEQELDPREMLTANFSHGIVPKEITGDIVVPKKRHTPKVRTLKHDDCTKDFVRGCEASQQQFGRRGIDNSNFSRGTAQSEKRGDNTVSRQRQARTEERNEERNEDYTTDYAREYDASNQEFEQKRIWSRGRRKQATAVNTASREDYTTDFARDYEASQREFGRRGIDDTNFSCAIAQSENRGDNTMGRQWQARTENATSHKDYTTDYAREYDASNQEFDQKRIRSRGRRRCSEQATADLDSEDCVA